MVYGSPREYLSLISVLMGHIRMWRDSLSRDSRVVCSRAS